MKKTVSKPPKEVPKITPKIDPDMPTGTVSRLLDALAGGKFILISKKDKIISVDASHLETDVDFLGLMEIAKIELIKHLHLGRKRNGR
jgi:hypothetical protein